MSLTAQFEGEGLALWIAERGIRRESRVVRRAGEVGKIADEISQQLDIACFVFVDADVGDFQLALRAECLSAVMKAYSSMGDLKW